MSDRFQREGKFREPHRVVTVFLSMWDWKCFALLISRYDVMPVTRPYLYTILFRAELFSLEHSCV